MEDCDRAQYAERFLSLPPELFSHVLQLVGRPVRLVSRCFYQSYGPVGGFLVLNSDNTPASLLHSPQHSLHHAIPTTPRFAHVHTLHLRPPSPPGAGLISALAPAFPALCSLHLPEDLPLTAAAMAVLHPLSRTLTHLSFPHSDSACYPALPAALPFLCSLDIEGSSWPKPTSSLPDVLTAIAGRLPQLQAFSYAWYDPTCHPPAPLMRQLSISLPNLTRLRLDNVFSDWDSEAADTLASAWPTMADLTLQLPYPAKPLGLAAALACHTALTRLELWGPELPEVDRLHPLRLRVLDLISCTSNTWLPMAARMGSITRLQLYTNSVFGDSWAGHLSHMADSLVSLTLDMRIPHWGPLVGLSCLSRLQHLRLCQSWQWGMQQAVTTDQVARALAAGLAGLRSLDVMRLQQPQLARSLVACLSGSGLLQEVSIRMRDMPGWAHLPALAGSLARLELDYDDSRPRPILVKVLAALAGLRRLHYLEVTSVANDDDEDDEEGGGSCVPTSSSLTSEDIEEAAYPEAAGAVEGGEEVRVLLPPRLRLLVVDGLYAVGDGRLQEAARKQECIILDYNVYDDGTGLFQQWVADCGGCVEGASWGWLRRHGLL